MATQQQIAKEHGMSFESVVKLYASHGHSMTDTAGIIGLSVPHFIKICRRNGWDELFVRGQQSVARQQADKDRQGKCTDKQRAHAERMRGARKDYATICYQGIDDTIAGHCRRLSLHYPTIKSRLSRHPGDYDYAFSKPGQIRRTYKPKDESRLKWGSGV